MTDLDIVQRNTLICALGDYQRVKAHQPDALVFICLGDFYETFNEDAITVARALDIVLTSIPNGRARAPMSGVPAAVAENYFARLIAQGHKVALLEPDAAPTQLPAAPRPTSAAVQLSLFAE